MHSWQLLNIDVQRWIIVLSQTSVILQIRDQLASSWYTDVVLFFFATLTHTYMGSRFLDWTFDSFDARFDLRKPPRTRYESSGTGIRGSNSRPVLKCEKTYATIYRLQIHVTYSTIGATLTIWHDTRIIVNGKPLVVIHCTVKVLVTVRLWIQRVACIATGQIWKAGRSIIMHH